MFSKRYVQESTEQNFIIGKYCKQPKCSSEVERINELWPVRPVKFKSSENELIIAVPTTQTLKTIMLKERSQTEKKIYCLTVFISS